jgi:hypothetical protein
MKSKLTFEGCDRCTCKAGIAATAALCAYCATAVHLDTCEMLSFRITRTSADWCITPPTEPAHGNHQERPTRLPPSQSDTVFSSVSTSSWSATILGTGSSATVFKRS